MAYNINSSLGGAWHLIVSRLTSGAIDHTLHNISTPKHKIVQKLFFPDEMPELVAEEAQASGACEAIAAAQVCLAFADFLHAKPGTKINNLD
jgi:hypothetical protein